MNARVNGCELHWIEVGAGAPVLLIHGFPLHAGMWHPQLERLPARWRLLAPDLRGFGRSEAGAEPPSIDLFADDMAGLLDVVGVERAVVCGLSMGGYIAFALWRRHTERIRALVLADTRAGADTEEGRRGRRELAERVRRAGSGAAADAMLPKLLAADAPDALRAEVRAMIEAAPPESVVRALSALADRPDSTGLLPEISVPVLVVVGSEDTLTPPAEAERIAAGVVDGRLTVIEGAGHLSNLEDSTAFNRALVPFLEATAGP